MTPCLLSAGKEGDGVGFQSPAVTGGEFFDHMGYARELIAWESVRSDQNSAMRPPIIEILNRKFDKVVSVPGHQTAFVLSRKIQLLFVRCFTHPNLMSTYGVSAILSKKDGNLRTEVLVQVELHEGDLMKG